MARWENVLDTDRMRAVLDGDLDEDPVQPVAALAAE
jgi:hypothetical protein